MNSFNEKEIEDNSCQQLKQNVMDIFQKAGYLGWECMFEHTTKPWAQTTDWI